MERMTTSLAASRGTPEFGFEIIGQQMKTGKKSRTAKVAKSKAATMNAAQATI